MSKTHTFHLLEEAIKQRDGLRDQIGSLIEILRPAIKESLARQAARVEIEGTSMSGYPSYANLDWEKADKALIEAGEVLGI